jgi:hypothetical protein
MTRLSAPEGTFWIGSDHPFDLHEAYINLRADLDLAAAPNRAVLHLTAYSRYRLWVNGQFVGRGPERSWPASMAVDNRDIVGLLRPGRNALAVQVYSPGYSHFAHVHRAAAGALGWLELDGTPTLKTDRSWRVRRDPSWDPQVPRVSIYGTGVERRDMARAEDWQTADATGWAAARIVQTNEGPIWGSLRPRATPLLEEDLLRLTTPWQTRLGPTPPETRDPHEDLRAAFAAGSPGPVPKTLAPGQTALWIFDLGQSRTCVAGARLTALGGERLTISYAEKLRDGDLLLPDPATYCRMCPTDRATLRAGEQEVEGFTLRGGRYLIFRLDAVAPLTPAPAFHARLPRYPLTERPLPPAGDATLDAVARMCRRTVLSCLQDGFVDSIWRESSQWLGDVVAEAFALQGISDDLRPLRLAIDMAAAGAAPDGILPSVLPGDVPAYVVTDYNFSWVELLAMYHAHPCAGDAEAVLHQHWPTLTRMLARFRSDLGPDGLIRSQPGRRLFLDWSGQDRAEPNLTYNLRYLHGLRTAAALNPAAPEAAHWAGEASALRQALRQTHRAEDSWRESPAGAPASQLALSLLILTATVTGSEAAALADRITARSLDLSDQSPPGALMLASPFMHHYVFQALGHLGRQGAIRAIIAARWGRWALAGEATTWENWDISFPDGSACHGFSAHPLGWLQR